MVYELQYIYHLITQHFPSLLSSLEPGASCSISSDQAGDIFSRLKWPSTESRRYFYILRSSSVCSAGLYWAKIYYRQDFKLVTLSGETKNIAFKMNILFNIVKIYISTRKFPLEQSSWQITIVLLTILMTTNIVKLHVYYGKLEKYHLPFPLLFVINFKNIYTFSILQ